LARAGRETRGSGQARALKADQAKYKIQKRGARPGRRAAKAQSQAARPLQAQASRHPPESRLRKTASVKKAATRP
jgi:hypothetical protein